jgi:hypothetical protein
MLESIKRIDEKLGDLITEHEDSALDIDTRLKALRDDVADLRDEATKGDQTTP